MIKLGCRLEHEIRRHVVDMPIFPRAAQCGVLANTVEPMIIVSWQGRILLLNKACKRLLDCAVGDILRREAKTPVPPEEDTRHV